MPCCSVGSGLQDTGGDAVGNLPLLCCSRRVLPAYTEACWPSCLGHATAWSQTHLSPGYLDLGYPQLMAQSPAQVRQCTSTHRGAVQHLLHSWAAPVLHAWRRRMLLGWWRKESTSSPIFAFSLLSPVLFDSFLLWPVTRSHNRKKKKEKEKCSSNNNNNNNSRCLHRWVSCVKQRTRGRPYLSLWRCASSFKIAWMFQLHERRMTPSNSGAFSCFYFWRPR